MDVAASRSPSAVTARCSAAASSRRWAASCERVRRATATAATVTTASTTRTTSIGPTLPTGADQLAGYGELMSERLFAPVSGATHQTFGPVEIDIAEVGDARIKRSIYPAGMRWSTDLGPLVGTDRCMHAHAGFLAHGSVRFEYADGCSVELTAPAVLDVAPGHDAWVVGDEPAVLIEVDFEATTTVRLGVPDEHSHE